MNAWSVAELANALCSIQYVRVTVTCKRHRGCLFFFPAKTKLILSYCLAGAHKSKTKEKKEAKE